MKQWLFLVVLSGVLAAGFSWAQGEAAVAAPVAAPAAVVPPPASIDGLGPAVVPAVHEAVMPAARGRGAERPGR